jgi:hypothetical protein
LNFKLRAVSMLVGVVLSAGGSQFQGQAVKAAKPAGNQDTITLSNGDTLTGKVSKVTFGKVTFHDDVLGDLTIPLSKIKSMNTNTAFAAGSTTESLTRKNVAEEVPVGKVSIENQTVKIAPQEGAAQEFPAKDLSFMLDADAYQRELHNESDFFYGWNGTATVGATLVEATNTSQTYTGTAAFIRAIPTIAGLPAGSKTILNLSGTYGLAKNPQIISGDNVYQTASVTKTDILHGDLEYDKFFSSTIFGLVNASADHNFGNGLQLQQAYGAGIGWAILRTPQNDLSFRAALQYEQQQFYNGITSGLGTPTDNLVGALIGETWNRTFPHNMKLNESITLSPTFNLVNSYSGVGSASFLFPVYKRLNFSITTTDNYLGDPPEGFLRNTFQLTTGITYTLK